MVIVMLILNWLSNEIHFRRAQAAYDNQLATYKKFDTEPRSLPREFSVKLTTFLIATPDEIAEALSKPEKRMRWDLHASSITKQDKNLSITYTTSQSRYLVNLQFFKQDATFLINELITINNGASQVTRVYVIEEVKNRPYFLRLTVY